MTSQQYEELCRFFLADQLHLPVDQVLTLQVVNPYREGLMRYQHQIDLYWETSSGPARYLNIANAKWRDANRVRQPDILLLQQVKVKVGAHKAVMITNSGFTTDAIAAAEDEGIGLLIVRPQFDAGRLPQVRREQILARIQELPRDGAPLYQFEITRKGLAPAVALLEILGQVVEPAASGSAGSGGEQSRLTRRPWPGTVPPQNPLLGSGVIRKAAADLGGYRGPGPGLGYRTK